ncbi:glutaredoxin 3 isoform X1 [Anopheles cruzii]|uniref:glutaredoxin 3 isoform X1 n=1 Tax=Anopheles cruzii TaxID=68878 RepID=UPI0022EC590B|nr:glutaredoxin 3 isoform X1 [Anopheles cruzii]
MVITKVTSEEQYKQLIGSAAAVSVVLFSAEWAEQCKQISDVMNELAKQPEFKTTQFLDVPAEDLSELSMHHQVDSVPTVLFFRAGTAIDRIDGVDVGTLATKARKYAGTSAPIPNSTSNSSSVSLEERLKGLINQSKVMIFMKGDRHTPRCGFSKQLIAIVNETGVEYDTFDILSDETVRQGLKTFSNWPTYPQVYVSGELIGGLDIIKELLEGGELKETLNP